MRQAKGFTLVELMIVIALVAIIGAIAVPAYQGYVRESRLTTMRMNLDTLRIAVEAHRLDNPASSYLNADVSLPYNTAQKIADAYGWAPEGDGNAYAYVVVPTSTTYNLCAGQLQASDTWVRCDKTTGAYNCTEGEKKSTAKTAAQACP